MNQLRQPVKTILKTLGLLGVSLLATTTHAAPLPVTEIYGDFGGYWTSTTASPQNTNDSNNLLAFTINDGGTTTTYSTGVNDGVLDANSVTYTPADFAAFPISNAVFTNPTALLGAPKNWTGTTQDGSATDVVLTNPQLPNHYLSDGDHGLELGTVIFNTPGGNNFDYDLTVLTADAVTDDMPDIIVTQMGAPAASTDTFQFVDASGATVGTPVSINFGSASLVGRQDYAFYNVTSATGASTYTSAFGGLRDTRLLALNLSDFGITAANYTQATQFVHTFSGGTDIAFVAYNRSSFAANPTDLAITATASNTCPSTDATLTVTVTNNGPNDALNFSVDAPIPAGLIFGTKTPSTGAYNETTGVWQIGALPNGQSATLTLTATTSSNPANFSFFAALGETLQTDTNPGNDQSSVSILDSDCDGIQNTADLDDDNDGILDSNECLASDIRDGFATQAIYIKPEYFVPNLSDYPFYNQDLQADISDQFGYPANSGAVIVDVKNASGIIGTAGSASQSTIFVGNAANPTEFIFSGSVELHLALTQGARLNAGTEDAITIVDGVPYLYAGTQPANTTVSNTDNYYYARNGGATDLSFLMLWYPQSAFDGSLEILRSKHVTFSTTDPRPSFNVGYYVQAIAECDTDRDGIPNRLDLDSDNDSCLDALEGSGSFTEDDLQNAVGVTVGTGSTANNQNLTTNDVDANGIPNVAGAAGQTIDDSQTAAQMTITQQPAGQSVTEGDSATFDVTSTAYQTDVFTNGTPDFSAQTPATNVTYQWLKSTDNGNTWTPIAAPAGTAEDLTLSNVTYADNGSQYKRTMVCDQNPCEVETNAATLNVNRSPVATNDSTTVNEDSAATGNIITDATADSDPDGDALTVTGVSIDIDGDGSPNPLPLGTATDIVVSGNVIGSLTVNSDGSYTFTPATNWNGSMPTATYTLSDGNGGTDTATLNVTVTPVNDPPVANNDNGSTDEDTTLTVSAADGLLNNDSDPEGDTLSVTQFVVDGTTVTVDPSTGGSTTIAGIGTLTINPDGSYVFEPATNFNGSVPTATYTVSDGNGGTDTATLDITVGGINDAPDAVDDNGGDIAEDGANGTVSILANDTDPDGTPTPTSGHTVDMDPSTPGIDTTRTTTEGVWTYDPSTGVLTFDPTDDFNGTATTPYQLCDADDLCDSATITFNVTPVNDPPVASNDTGSIEEDTTLTVSAADGLLNNDSDPEGDTLTVTQFVVDGTTVTVDPSTGGSTTIADVGTLTINPDGSYVFEPVTNFNDSVPTVTYTVSDGNGGTDTADLNLTVTPVNDPPVATDGSITPAPDTPISVPLVGTDIDGSVETVTITSGPSSDQGTLVYDHDGDPSTVPVPVPVGTPITLTQSQTVEFVPTTGYTGNVDPVTFTVTDNDGATSSPATVNIDPIKAIDVTAPEESIDTTPTITGTTTAPVGSTVTVVVTDSSGNPQTLTGTVQPDGTYSVTPTTPLSPGTYTVVSSVDDGNGNTITATDTGSVTVPLPTVNSQTTSDTTPVLTGGVNSGTGLVDGQTLQVTISDATYLVPVNPDGTWTLDLETATPISGTLTPLKRGQQYEVVAVIYDRNGQELTRDTSNVELTIVSTSPQGAELIPASDWWSLWLLVIGALFAGVLVIRQRP